MSRAGDFIDNRIVDRIEKQHAVTQPSHFNLFIKRSLDVLSTFFGLILLSPFFLFIAIRIKRDSPGPVFYRGPRSGRHGKVFQILKFRTMYESPESYQGPQVTGKNDTRITKFGSWLRDSKVNELPQLWNVFKGEMSLVGPRPEVPEIVEGWPVEVRDEILSMRPGITSPASVLYRDEQEMLGSANVMDEYLRSILPDKLRLDQLYVRYFSFLGDLDVVFMTLTLIFPMLRNAKVQEKTLFEGPLAWFIRKFLTWFVIDAMVAFVGISLVVLIWRAVAPLDIGFFLMLLTAVVLSLLLAITNTLFGVKQITWRYASPIHVLDLAVSTSFAMALFALVASYLHNIQLQTPLLIEFGLFSFIGFVVVRYRERLITGLASRWLRWRSQRNTLGERILIIGAGDCGQLALWLLEKSSMAGAFSVVGFMDDDLRKVGQRINGLPVLGTVHDLQKIISQKSIGLVMFAINKISPADRDKILAEIKDLPVRVLMIPELLTVLSNYLLQQSGKEEAAHG